MTIFIEVESGGRVENQSFDDRVVIYVRQPPEEARMDKATVAGMWKLLRKRHRRALAKPGLAVPPVVFVSSCLFRKGFEIGTRNGCVVNVVIMGNLTTEPALP